MLRFPVLFLCLAPLLAFGQQKVTMRVIVQGKDVGMNSYEQAADGSFTSLTMLDFKPIQDLKTVTISSSASGHLVDGKLLDLTSKTSTLGGDSSVSGELSVNFSNGHVLIKQGEASKDVEWKDTTGALGGFLHPQLFATTLALAQKAFDAQQSVKGGMLSVFIVDRGVAMPMTVTKLPSQEVEVAGKKITARSFAVDGGGQAKVIFVLDEAGNVAIEDIPGSHEKCVRAGWEAVKTDSGQAGKGSGH